MGEVEGVDPRPRVVRRRSAELYDYLVLATGATHAYFGPTSGSRSRPA